MERSSLRKKPLSEELADVDKPAWVFKLVGAFISLLALLAFFCQELEWEWLYYLIFALAPSYVLACFGLAHISELLSEKVAWIAYAVPALVVIGYALALAAARKRGKLPSALVLILLVHGLQVVGAFCLM
jgi:hypothetical protein